MPDETQDAASAIVTPQGKPARLPRTANCPRCGAGPDRRVRSGMGALVDVTCERCAFEYEKERGR